MIGPQWRKPLRLAALVYMLFGPIATIINVYQTSSRPEFEIVGAPATFWLHILTGLVSTVIQGGVLLALLSIDERLERKEA